MGGAIATLENVVLTFSGTNNFTSNSANNGGAIYANSNTSLIFSGMSYFSHNSADIGGTIGTVNNVTFTFNGTDVFVNNSARDNGGEIYAVMNTSLRFIGTNTSAGIEGGAADDGVLTFNELTTSTTQKTTVVQSLQDSTY